MATQMSILTKYLMEKGTKKVNIVDATNFEQGFQRNSSYDQECYKIQDKEAKFLNNYQGGGSDLISKGPTIHGGQMHKVQGKNIGQWARKFALER